MQKFHMLLTSIQNFNFCDTALKYYYQILEKAVEYEQLVKERCLENQSFFNRYTKKK